MQRIIIALDGGLLPPGDNILTALRGTEDATAERNVIDSLAQAKLAEIRQVLATIRDNADNVEPVLEQVRDLLQ